MNIFLTKERRAFSEITQSQCKKPKSSDLETNLWLPKGESGGGIN